MLGRALGYTVEFERLGRVVSRIVRGLYWHHEGQIVPSGHNVGAIFEDTLKEMPSTERQDLLSKCVDPLRNTPMHSTPREVLRYRYQIAPGAAPVSAWLLEFYEDVRCLALLVPDPPQ